MSRRCIATPTASARIVRECARDSFAALADEIADRVATEMPGAVIGGSIDDSVMDCGVRRSRVPGARRVYRLWEGALTHALLRRIAARQGPPRDSV